MADEAVFQEIRDEWGTNLPLVARGKDPIGMLQPISRIMEREPRAIDIVRSVSQITGVSIPEIRGNRRTRRIARARYAMSHLMELYCVGITRQQIASHVGRFDHGTIDHQLKRAKALLDTDATFRSVVARAEHELGF